MKRVTVLLLSLIVAACAANPVAAEELEFMLGLKTNHFAKQTSPCTNESHDLFGIKYKSFIIGTYDNSQCVRSNFVGVTTNVYGVDASIAFTSGYVMPYKVFGLTPIPMLSYTVAYRGFGLRFMTVPLTLTGVGLVYKFQL